MKAKNSYKSQEAVNFTGYDFLVAQKRETTIKRINSNIQFAP